MNEQLSLFEIRQPRRLDLVFAVFPDYHTAKRIYEFGDSFRRMRGLTGRMRPVSHLHVSLPLPYWGVVDLETAVETIDRACQAIAAVTSPFEIKFDRIMSFGGGFGNRPLVLAGDGHENRELRRLHGLLWTELANNNSVKVSVPNFSPHLSFLYCKQQLARIRVEPVCWTVKEIALVLSEKGATKYHRLGCWAFGG